MDLLKHTYEQVTQFTFRGVTLTLYKASIVGDKILTLIDKVPSKLNITLFMNRDGNKTYALFGPRIFLQENELESIPSLPIIYYAPFSKMQKESPWPTAFVESQFISTYSIVIENDEMTLFYLSGGRDLEVSARSKLSIKDNTDVSRTDWITSCDKIITNIKEGKLKKAVLSRTKSIQKNCSSRDILKRALSSKKRENFIFYHEFDSTLAFISLSPERILLKEKDTFATEALAGTIPLTQSSLSEKDRIEHDLVIEGILQKLKTTKTVIAKVASNKLIKLPLFQHIYTSIEGNSKDSAISLVNTLHPTPALGGHPASVAMTAIDELENFDRGLFGAPMGVLGRHNEILVGIRSALIDSRKMTLFAGAGIVIHSEGEAEWEETERKMKTIESLIVD